MENITVKKVTGKADKKAFIDFAYQLYRNEENWVPPFRMEMNEFLDPKKHPFYEHGTITPFIALRNGEVVGRIAAITNGNHNKFYNDKTGFFGFFEAIEDEDVFRALADAAVAELKERGKDKIYGPVSPSLHDISLFLTDGFHLPPMVMMSYNFPYYADMFYKIGYEKVKGFYAYYLPTKLAVVNEKMKKVERILEKRGFKVRNLDMKNFQKEAEIIFDIYREAWSGNWGFVPMSHKEFEHTVANLKMLAREKLVYFVEKDGKAVAMSVALPDINEVLVNNRNGALRPDIIFKLLQYIKNPRNVRIMLLGVRPEYETFGLGGVLYAKYIRMAYKEKLEGGEMSWILDDNVEMNRAAELMQGHIYKRYVMVGKDI